MRGCTFITPRGTFHTFNTWALYLKEYPDVGPAEMQTTIIPIPGRDGPLDLSTALDGEMHYNTRTITLELMCIAPRKRWPSIHTAVASVLHGQRCRIILDDDPSFYYVGRVSVEAGDYTLNDFSLTLTAEVEPYKYELRSSLEQQNWRWDDFDLDDGIVRDYAALNVDGVLDLAVDGRRMTITPVVTARNIGEDGLAVIFNRRQYDLVEGRNTILEIRIAEGENRLRFIGSGTVSVEYRGGAL